MKKKKKENLYESGFGKFTFTVGFLGCIFVFLVLILVVFETFDFFDFSKYDGLINLRNSFMKI